MSAIECPICFTPFDLHDRLPKTLCSECNQTVCAPCAAKCRAPPAEEKAEEEDGDDKEKNKMATALDLSSLQQELDAIREAGKGSADLVAREASLRVDIQVAETHVRAAQVPKKPDCPFCRKELNLLKPLMNNHLVVQILETQLLHAHSPTFIPACASCVRVPPENASGYCRSCRKFLCPAHSKIHGEQKETHHHRLLTLQELHDDPSQLEPPTSYCSMEGHGACPLDTYCKQCEVPVCDKCWKFKHRLHEVEEPLTAFDRIHQTAVIPLLAEARDEIKQLEEHIGNAETFTESTRKQHTEVEASIKARYQQMRDTLETDERKALADLSREVEKRLWSFREEKEGLSGILKKLTSSVGNVEAMFRKEHPVPSLSMYKGWVDAIRALVDTEWVEIGDFNALVDTNAWGKDVVVDVPDRERKKDEEQGQSSAVLDERVTSPVESTGLTKRGGSVTPIPTGPELLSVGPHEGKQEHNGQVVGDATTSSIVIVSGSHDGNLCLWLASSSGSCLQTLEGHTGRVVCVVAVSSDIIVSGSWDKTLRVWQVSSATCLRILKGHRDNVTCVTAASYDVIVSGSDDGILHVWQVSTGECLRTLAEGPAEPAVRCVASTSSDVVVSGSADGRIRVWQVSSGKCLRTLGRHNNGFLATVGPVTIAAISSDVVVTGADRSYMWRLSEGNYPQEWIGRRISCVTVVSSDVIATGSDDGILRILQASSGICLQSFTAVRGPPSYDAKSTRIVEGRVVAIRCVTALSADVIACGYDDNVLRILRLSSGKCLRTLADTGTVGCIISISSDVKFFLRALANNSSFLK